MDSSPLTEPARLADIAKRPEVSLEVLLRALGWDHDPGCVESVNIELKYFGYVAKDRVAVSRIQQLDHYRIPPDLDYSGLHSMSHESREKLQAIRPESLGQASRVPGVSPSDIQNLVCEIARRSSCFTGNRIMPRRFT